MRRSMVLPAALAIAATVFATAPAQAVPRTEAATYVGGSGVPTGFCQAGIRPGVARTCFKPAPYESRVTISVREIDPIYTPVPFYFVFTNAAGNCADGGPVATCAYSGTGCGSAVATFPSTAKDLFVYPQDPALGALTCVLTHPARDSRIATVIGQATATFT